jgi:hypothetical protein
MVNVIIIHGAYGSPKENWIPWLRKELVRIGCKVIVPKFPTPKGQSLRNWMKVLDKHKKQFGPDTVIVAHSLGPALVLRKLEKLDKPIRAVFLVAGFLGALGLPDFDGINASFFAKRFEWARIRRNAGRVFLYGSDNDPYVPIREEKEFARKLRTRLVMVKGAGHFNKKAGYVKFPRLLKDIKRII